MFRIFNDFLFLPLPEVRAKGLWQWWSTLPYSNFKNDFNISERQNISRSSRTKFILRPLPQIVIAGNMSWEIGLAMSFRVVITCRPSYSPTLSSSSHLVLLPVYVSLVGERDGQAQWGEEGEEPEQPVGGQGARLEDVSDPVYAGVRPVVWRPFRWLEILPNIKIPDNTTALSFNFLLAILDIIRLWNDCGMKYNYQQSFPPSTIYTQRHLHIGNC